MFCFSRVYEATKSDHRKHHGKYQISLAKKIDSLLVKLPISSIKQVYGKVVLVRPKQRRAFVPAEWRPQRQRKSEWPLILELQRIYRNGSQILVQVVIRLKATTTE